MTALVDPYRWQALGDGYFAPSGSVIDPAMAARVAAYKRDVAGAYRSVPPGDVGTTLPAGPCIVSEKVDGETWFLHRADGTTTLVSPTGKAITNVPLTNEADTLLADWSGLLAGELYAACDGGRPRVFDLHAALGGGERAQIDRLRFAAFDLLLDEDVDTAHAAFSDRVDRVQGLLRNGRLLHAAAFEMADSPDKVAAAFERIVTQGGAEGLVVHARDGRIFKIKPEITLDSAVVAYAGTAVGVSELLLAMLAPDGRYQLIGRVRLGWSHEEGRDLADRLATLPCPSTYRSATDHGTLYRWVRPELVVEVRCNDLLAVDTRDHAIRRMRLDYEEAAGWSPLGPTPSVSLINAVFLRVRDDKRAQRPDVRFEQITDLVEVPTPTPIEPTALAAPEILRREVYTKRTKGVVAVRKLVAWRTNRSANPAWPAFVVHFTDYAPGRSQPLKTDVRVASNEAVLHTLADDWLAEHIRRGWEAVSVTRAPTPDTPTDDERTGNDGEANARVEAPSQGDSPAREGHRLTIALARSSSPTFPIVRRRLDTLASLGSLEITRDDKDREAWFELHIDHTLVQSARRIANLLNIVRAWKTTEVSLDDELLGKHEMNDVIERLETVRRCWLRRKSQGGDGCRRSCTIGCEALRIWPTHEDLRSSGIAEPPWWAVGSFDGERVTVDKPALHEQVAASRNSFITACPLFEANVVAAKIDALPDLLTPDDTTWVMVYSRDGKPSWVWPSDVRTPFSVQTSPDTLWHPEGATIRLDLTSCVPPATEIDETNPLPTPSTPQPARSIPPTRYTDVVGQDAAVEAVRDLVELPLLHADLFKRIGARPQAHGILLAGPPGTGKTLLARAVAGECGAHVEIVSGPALLSKWVGESEAALRAVFERAQEVAPSVILFDEIDSLAPRRSGASAQYNVSLVAQLLVLLDGMEERGQVFVLGTTNRPDSIDPALRRPGRFDQVVWMDAPDQAGRAALFAHHLRGLKLAEGLDRATLAEDLAVATEGCTGADVAYACQRAATICVKEAARTPGVPDDLAITAEHFRAAVATIAALPQDPAVKSTTPLRAAG